MSKTIHPASSKSEHDEIWDDSLLIKAYEESVKLQREDVAKELAMKTNTKLNSQSSESSSSLAPPSEDFKVGDFVRCTYEDGVDYEAEILSINENGTATLRYIGYDNIQRAKVEDLVTSWGKEAREEQKLLAEADNPSPSENERAEQEELHTFVLNKTKGIHGKLPVPPMPPMPPGICDSTRDSEYMSAMLMSWYMSGYYTGLYHGRKEVMQELNVTSKQQEIEKSASDDKKFESKRQRKRNIDKR